MFFVDKMPIDKTPVDKTPVDKMPIYKTPVDKTPVDNFVSFDPILTKFRSKQLKIWSRSRI